MACCEISSINSVDDNKSDLRCRIIISKHEMILKQYSSTHFAMPTVSQELSHESLQLLSELGSAQRVASNGSSDKSNDPSEPEPALFEFPYYLNTISRNLVRLKRYFVQEEKRVEALKVSIESARLLVDEIVLSDAQFYPAIYVLVSKLLQQFGGLVYSRVSSTSHRSLKCTNWLYKISAIRELVPRLLLEISLYRTLSLLYPARDLIQYSLRLVKRLRGICNPLVAAYVSMFVVEQVFLTFDDETCHRDTTHHVYFAILTDILNSFKSMYDSNFSSIDSVFYGQMATQDYLTLFKPVFSMLFTTLNSNKAALKEAGCTSMYEYVTLHIDKQILMLIDFDSYIT